MRIILVNAIFSNSLNAHESHINIILLTFGYVRWGNNLKPQLGFTHFYSLGVFVSKACTALVFMKTNFAMLFIVENPLNRLWGKDYIQLSSGYKQVTRMEGKVATFSCTPIIRIGWERYYSCIYAAFRYCSETRRKLIHVNSFLIKWVREYPHSLKPFWNH